LRSTHTEQAYDHRRNKAGLADLQRAMNRLATATWAWPRTPTRGERADREAELRTRLRRIAVGSPPACLDGRRVLPLHFPSPGAWPCRLPGLASGSVGSRRRLPFLRNRNLNMDAAYSLGIGAPVSSLLAVFACCPNDFFFDTFILPATFPNLGIPEIRAKDGRRMRLMLMGP
jgi:hypothetical protein